MEHDLLKDLAIASGCAYISDLTQMSYRADLPMALESMDWQKYSVEQWNDAVNYITRDARIFENAEDAYHFLIESLTKTRNGNLF